MTITIDTLNLAHGGHNNPTEGLCLLEAVAYFAHEDHTDHPQCVSPILTAYGIRLNDRLNDTERQALKPYIFRMIGTRGDGRDDARRLVLANAVRREILPKWLDRAGIIDLAAQLRALPEFVTLADVLASRDLVDRAYQKAITLRTGWYERIRAAVRKKLDGADAAAAADDAVADAVAVAVAAAAVAVAADVADAAAAADAAGADAAAVAVAVAVADAAVAAAADVADAAAVAVAVAVADAAAVAVAVAADAVAADVAADAADAAAVGYWRVRNRVYDAVKARLEPLYVDWRTEAVSEAVTLLDRLIAP